MFGVGADIEIGVGIRAKGIADGIKSSVAGIGSGNVFAVVIEGNGSLDTAALNEMGLNDINGRSNIHIMLFEYCVNLIRQQLLVFVVGNALDQITNSFTHFLRQIVAESGLEYITDTAFSGLAVDTDNVCGIFSSNVLRVDGQVRNGPVIGMTFLTPFHALCDSVLMRTAECCEHKLSGIWLTFTDCHSGDTGIKLSYRRNIAEIKLRINALGIHIQGEGNDIDITCAFAVSEKSAFNSVCTGKESKLSICDSTAPVVVGVQGNDNVFTVFEVIAHILYLVSVNIGSGKLNSDRQIDNDLILSRRLPDIKHRIADFQSKFRFCAGEAFRRIFKAEIAFILVTVLFAELST